MVLDRPGRLGRPAPQREAGLCLFVGVLLAMASGACAGPSPEVADPEVEAARELGLAAGARVHRVTLGGRGAEEHAVPSVVDAVPGDAVEFVTVDHRVHTVIFPTDSLAPEVRAFLESTGQLESPPLPVRGSRHLVLLEGAPPGRYPFLSEGHGGITGGTVRVGFSPDARPQGRGN